MARSSSSIIPIVSLRGGLNNTDPEIALPDDQVTSAVNVEFNLSLLGERRKGATAIDLPAAITGDANIQAITFLMRHLPVADTTDAELWVLGQHLSSQNYTLQRRTTSWSTITPSPNDAIDVTANRGAFLTAQSLHGKLFISYRSVGAVDRLHVWDGTTLRRTGLAEPAAPTAADTGAGSLSGTRYYRVRYSVLSGSTVLLRSEPSDVLTFAPSGSGSAVRVTKPATISEGETHWELEASFDNANFYRIATTAVGTTTYDDSVASSYATAAGAVLSEDIGDYTLIHSGKFLSADEDRLLIGGSWEDVDLKSRVSWTPVYNDPGVGNDERIPIDIDSYIDLDGSEGGELTGLSRPVNGYVYAFKQSHTYRLVRTGDRNDAYRVVNISKSIGAIPGSLIEGIDQSGMACLYFLDPELGPCRTGGNKVIQQSGSDILTTWRDVNIDAIVVARGIFYPDTKQIHWWVATSDPNQT